MSNAASPVQLALQRMLSKTSIRLGLAILAFFAVLAIFAPFFVSETALVWIDDGGISFPILLDLFNRNIYEERYDVFFNCLAVFSPVSILMYLLLRKYTMWGQGRITLLLAASNVLLWVAVQIPYHHSADGLVGFWRPRAVTYCTASFHQRTTSIDPTQYWDHAQRGDTVRHVNGTVYTVHHRSTSKHMLACRPYGEHGTPLEFIPPTKLSLLSPSLTLFPLIANSHRMHYQDAVLKDPGTFCNTTGQSFILGTDEAGRDVAARMVFGARISLTVGFAATGLALFIGLIVGAISGYFGGRVDILVQRLVEIMMNFPTFLLALIIVAVWGKDISTIIIVFGVTGWAGTARLVRGEYLAQAGREYVLAAECLGLPKWRIMFIHILPNVMTPLLISAIFGIAGTILGESGLAFLGLIDANTPSWGLVLNEARKHTEYIHLVYTPGFAIFALVSALNVVGNGLREAFDPKSEDATNQQPVLQSSDHRTKQANPTTMLSFNDIHIRFEQGGQAVNAVRGMSFDIQSGEVVALVGESGSGKSVSALSSLRLLDTSGAVYPTGNIVWKGENILAMSDERLRRLRGNEISFISQEPMSALNPTWTCGRQVAEALELHTQLTPDAIYTRCIELLNAVGLPDPEQRYEQYPHELSGGMRQRVCIAIALACDPDLLIADEPTTALDVTVQAQILDVLKELQRDRGMAILFITHDLGVVAELADKVVIMWRGEKVEEGPVTDIFAHPQHPYTKGLLACRPRLGQNTKRLPTIDDFLET